MKPTSQMTLDVYFRQCVGIDISKDKFTACLYMYDRASDVGCCTKSIDFDNTKSGFNQMVRWSRKEAVKSHPLTYLMEPTGVYYEHLAYHLHKIGQIVYVVLPNKARKFCESEGIKTKTDAMDGPLPGTDGVRQPQAEAVVSTCSNLSRTPPDDTIPCRPMCY